ncbi:MAG: ROK family protein [Clostridiales bacterium]|nr:ROK family protein [Clostridiales bacterium]
MFYRIGIDIGGTNIKAGIIDGDNIILEEDSIPTRVGQSWQKIVSDMASLANRLAGKRKISGVGVGCPGIVDASRGIVFYSNNLGWEFVPLADELSKYFQCFVRISNDANCAALGEVCAGAAKGAKSAVLLTLGTGVGSGIIVDGQIFEGAHAGGAELGHTNLICGGEPCTCGRRGCVEAYVSATALIRDARRAAEADESSKLNALCGGDLSKMDAKIPFDAAEAGDRAANAVIERYLAYLGEAVVDVANIFRPDVVLLSGGVSAQGDRLTGPVTAYMKKYAFGGKRAFLPDVRIASLGNHAGIVGAANLIQ